jgi:hypothetical protein
LSTFIARQRWTFAAAGLVAVVYAVSLSMMPKHVFWMPDEGAKLFELEACGLSWKDGVTYRIPFAGQRLLPMNDYLPGFDVFPEPKTGPDGSLYLEFDTPVAFPLLTAPFFHALGPPGLYVIPLLSGCAVALLSGLLAAWFAAGLGPPTVLLVGLATPVWFYSVVFWEHTLATLLGLMALWLFVRAPRRIESLAATVPLLLAASILRTEMAALGAAFAVAWVVVLIEVPAADTSPATALRTWVFGGRWRLLLVTVVLTIALAALLDVMLTSRHRAMIRVLPERIDQALGGITHTPRALFEVFLNSQNLGPRVGVAWSAAAVAAVLLALIAPLIRSAVLQVVTIVAASSLMLACSVALLLTGEPYRGLHGLFPVAPFAIFWPFALHRAWRRHDAPLLALATATLAYLLLTFGALAITYIHKGLLDVGMQWGQRYLLTAYPMLTILTLVGLRALRSSIGPGPLRAAAVALVALLVASGVGLELRGMRMLYATRSLVAGWDRAMRAEGPIVTSVWWIVPAVANLFLTHEMFFTWQPGVARWVELARQRGVAGFTLAHTEPISDEQLGVPGIQRDSAGTRTIAGGLLLTRFRIDPVPVP